MSTIVVFRKTPAGEAEIGTRALNLPVKLRSLLIAVDGKKSSDDLARSFSAFGDIPAMMTELEQKKCIERVPAPVVQVPQAAPVVQVLNEEARKYMASYLYDALGPESDSLVRRIEKCRTNADLARMLDACRDALAAMGKKKTAEEFWAMGSEMLQGDAGPAPQALNREAKQYMASYLYNTLGPESDSLVGRIEKCRTNVDLERVLDECRDTLAAMGKKKKAEELWAMGREMLQ